MGIGDVFKASENKKIQIRDSAKNSNIDLFVI